MYYDYALAAPFMASADAESASLRVLVLGNGSGTYATQCRSYFPACSVTGVEIDGKITDLAERYFSLPDDVPVVEYDGRAFLQAADEKYDVILVDAYQDITIPFQMSSVEFFSLVRDHLDPGGVMVVNMNMHSDGEGSINEYLCDTIASLFPFVSTADVSNNTNRELFASMSADPAVLLSGAVSSIKDVDLRQMMDIVLSGLTPAENGAHILTDDKAPVEVLGMRMIDSLIEDEVRYYKQIYQREGLRGLLSNLT